MLIGEHISVNDRLTGKLHKAGDTKYIYDMLGRVVETEDFDGMSKLKKFSLIPVVTEPNF